MMTIKKLQIIIPIIISVLTALIGGIWKSIEYIENRYIDGRELNDIINNSILIIEPNLETMDANIKILSEIIFEERLNNIDQLINSLSNLNRAELTQNDIILLRELRTRRNEIINNLERIRNYRIMLSN